MAEQEMAEQEMAGETNRQVPASVVVIGAGPAGLTAAFELMKAGAASRVTVLEADDVVGGISQTVERDGWRFDIGGHRFFTKVRSVDELWDEILAPEKMLDRPRQSRLLYRGKLYDYPLVPMNALRNLGPVEAVRCVGSYLWVRIHPPKNRDTLEGFMAARFGWRLYRHFFKTYTEKVWGVPATELSADWGAQRVKDLSLMRAVVEAVKPKRLRRSRDSATAVTSLIEEFKYPKYGPGLMWEVAADKVTAAGARLEFDRRVTRISHDGDGAREVVAVDSEGREHAYPCSHVISSMPLGALCQAMEPPVDTPTQDAASELRHRDHLTVALVVRQQQSFPDNWIYVHDPEVEVGRVQNYGSWSPYMVKDGKTCLGLEFFVSEGDAMWTKPDDELLEQGVRELVHLGLIADADSVETGYVVRMRKAYPVYDEHYQEHVATMRKWIAARTPNVYPCGRNGMHKYNNQDHSMLTAMLSVENILGAEHDVWAVNVEADYLEEASGEQSSAATGRASSGATGRDAPVLPRRALDDAAAARAAGPKADAAGR
jgi:protoporphyrinogen oxidase